MRHTFAALIQVAPEKASKQLVATFKANKCHYGRTCKSLGCSPQTLARWTKQLDIKGELEAMEQKAQAEGWHHGIHGGAQFHKDPKAAAQKRIQSIAATLRAKRDSGIKVRP